MDAKIITQLHDEAGLDRTVERMAKEIIRDIPGLKDVAIIGMQTRGVHIAKRIRDKIKKLADIDVQFGILDVSFYRDDFRIRMKSPSVQVSEIPFSIDDLHIILVDDVLYTGRTIRAALNAIMDYGRPSHIDLAVLVDRGHRELPVQANFVGTDSETEQKEEIRVRIREIDGEDAVYIVEAPK